MKAEREVKFIPWHRLFGLTLTDFFWGSSYKIELEKDLSIKQQLLDVVIIEKKNGKIPDILPDGLEDLAAHNLMTYKSHRESLDGWTIEELCGHYVNYRKQVSPDFNNLLPATDFRLFAVSTRYPENLSREIKFTAKDQPGVYDIKWGIRNIRIIVLSRINKSEKNAPWLIFSAVPEKIEFGAISYRWKTPVSTVMNDLLNQYKLEGVTAMTYTIEDFQKEAKERFINSLSKDDIKNILDRLDTKERLRGLKPEERLKGIKPEEIFKWLKPEDALKSLKPEERLKGMKPEEIEAYLEKIKHKKQP